MPILHINIPGNIINRIENGVAKKRGRPDTVPNPGGGPNIPNPKSKSEFLMDALKEFLVEDVSLQEASDAGNVASDSAKSSARSDFDSIQVTT